MAIAQGFIPADQFTVPKGLDAAQTPQGGSAFKDTAGTYGVAGSLYLKGANGYTLAPATLPGNTPNVTNTVNPTSPQDITGTVQPDAPVAVQPTGTTVKTVPTVAAPKYPTFQGAPAGSVSSTPPPTPAGVDAAGNPIVPQKTAAQIQSEADALGSAPLDSGVGTRSSAKVANSFQSYLDGLSSPIPAAPTAPDTNAETTAQNAIPGGVNDTQTQLTSATDTLTKLQNDLQQKQAGEASKPGVIATIINGRMQMLSAEESKALNDQKLVVSNLTTQLRNANTAVQTFIKNQATDYATAEKNYEFEYTKALTAYNDEQSQQDKQQTSAKANAQVIINSYKGSSIGFDSVTDQQKAQWENLESQAGLPTGTIEAAVKAELNIQKFVKGGDGSMYVTGTDDSGVPFTAKIMGSYGAGSGIPKTTGGTPTQQSAAKLKSDTSKMSGALDSAKGIDGMVSNADWNAALQDWIKAGYTTAQFNTAFKSYKSTNK